MSGALGVHQGCRGCQGCMGAGKKWCSGASRGKGALRL